MIFKIFDAEKTPVSQGFEPYSYDVIVASNVLHATASLQKTLAHTRQLLKPGGYLLLLEITDNEPIYGSTVFGALPGWWLGVNDGRRYAPTVTPREWHSVLRKAGFGGIDAITPKSEGSVWPFSVIASQAVDDNVTFLRRPLSSPLPFAPIESLVILGTGSLESAQISEELSESLSRFCLKTVILDGLPTEAEALELATSSTFVNLVDLDSPIFKNFTADKMDGLKRVFELARHVLWITNGAMDEEPYHMASLAFSRSISNEAAHITLNMLDVAKVDSSVPSVISEQLLRQFALEEYENQNLLWTKEPETFLRGGKLMLPRLLHNTEQNARLNSSRRLVTRSVPLSKSDVSISYGPASRFCLVEDARPLLTESDNQACVRADASTLMALRVGSDAFLFLAIGQDASTGRNLVAVSATSAQATRPITSVPVNKIDSVPSKLALLLAITGELLAESVVLDLPARSRILVHHSNQHRFFASALSRRAVSKNIRVMFSSDAEDDIDAIDDGHDTRWIKLANRAPRHVLRKTLLRVRPTHFFDLSPGNLSQSLANVLSQECKQIDSSNLFRVHSALPSSLDQEALRRRLTTAIDAATATAASVVVDGVEEMIIPLHSISRKFTPGDAASVVQWPTEGQATVEVRPLDARQLFSGDKTYILFGLSGQLGQSLCDWMVSQGAGCVCLTSRHPRVDPRWLESFDSTSSAVRVFPMDITDKESVSDVIQTIRSTCPPIAGAVNGAMVLSDALFASMSFDQMQMVLGPKIDGSNNIDRAFYDENLDFFILLSSGAGVVGNSGQSNYAATSGYLNGLARHRRRRGLAASTIDIGMVTGIGYVETAGQHVVDQLGKYGLSILSEPDFRRAFAETIQAGYPSPNDKDSIPDAVVTTGIRTMLDGETNVTWRNNPIFSHCIITEAKVIDSGVDGQSRNRAAAIPVMEQIAKASSREEVLGMIQGSFLSKLRVILQNADLEMDHDDPLVEVGIDSLVAVEVRSWFLKDLKVDVPVLKIVGGASLADICDLAMNKLPETLFQSLGKGSAAEHKPAHTLSKSQSVAPSKLTSSDASSRLDSEDGSSPAAQLTPALSVTEPCSKSQSNVSLADDSDTKEAATELHLQPPPQPVIPKTIIRRAELTPGQLGHLRLMKLLQNPSHLNIACLIKVDGALRADKLVDAAHAVSRRHEALRTSFVSGESAGRHDDADTIQAVFLESGVLVEEGAVEDEAAAQAEYARLERHTFDLANGECMRIAILAQSPRVHFVVIVWNHLIMDGASFEIFWADLVQAYNGKTLPDSVPQYADYAEKQLVDIKNGNLDGQVEFWRQKLSPVLDQDPLPILPFADVRHRQSLATYGFHSAKRTSSIPMTRLIRSACQKLKANAFHFYFAVFKVLLTKLLQIEDRDLCIGMANANRLDQGATEGIGNYANALPIVFPKSEKSKTFQDVLRQTRTEVLKALANSQVPYDVLLDELQVVRSASYSPLYHAFVNYRSGAKEKRILGSAQAEFKNWSENKAGYDIILDVVDNPGGQATVSMQVQKGLYTQEEAAVLLGLFDELLSSVVRYPTSTVAQLSIYTKQDEERALKAGRAEVTGPEAPEQSTLVHATEEMVNRYPDRVALRDSSGDSLTYAGMAKRVNAIAAALASKGLPTGSIIGAFQHPTVDWACSMLASMRLGLVHLSLDPRFPAARLRAVTDECRLAAVIVNYTTSKDEVSVLGLADDRIITIEDCEEATTPPSIVATPSMLATLLYTSGSTGKPKGFLLKHEGLLNEVQDSTACFQMTPEDVVLQQSAITFDAALWEVFIAIANGGTAVVVSRDHRVDPSAVTSLLSSEEVTVTIATPTEYSLWIRDGSVDAIMQSPLRLACATGEMLSRAHSDMILGLQKPGLRLNNAYGPSETSIVISKTDILPSQTSEQGRRVRNPVGYTGRNRSIYIVDSELRLLPIGFSGEVIVGGCGVGVGYLENESLTAEKFIHDPWAGPDQKVRGWTRMYRTGDRGFLDEDGCLTLESRMLGDTELKLRGIRMDVQDVEKAIIDTGSGAIRDAVVSVRGEADADAQYLVAHLIYDDNVVPQSEQKDFYTNHVVPRLPLPQYMCPGIAIPTKELPMNRNGKLDRAKVAALPVYSPGSRSDNREAQNRSILLSDAEQQLRELWLKVLPTGAVELFNLGRESDFFHIGGDSGSLVRLHRLIVQTFQVTFPLIQLFKFSSLRAMAANIQDQSQAARSIEWEKETAIDWAGIVSRATEIFKLKSAQPTPGPSHGKTVVLTGATGNLASAVLPELSASDEIAEVHCVAIRDMAKAEAVLDAISLSPQQRAKVRLYPGDLTAPRLGVASEGDFARLMATADAIVHLAAARAFWDDYHVLRAGNVTSVRELLLLAAPRRIPVHFLSSGGVTRYDAAANTEQQQQQQQYPPADGSDGYVSGKWVVERILHSAARELGLAATVYRTLPLKAGDGDAVDGPAEEREEALNAFVRHSKAISALPSDSVSSWHGHVDLLRLATIAQAITQNIITTKKPEDSNSAENVITSMVQAHDAETRVTIADITSHLNTQLDNAQEGFERIDVLEWMGRLKRAGFPYMLASLSLMYRSTEHARPMVLER